MIPEWMKKGELYVPPKDGGTFYIKTIKAIGGMMSRLKIQRGHEKSHALPALLKLVILVLAILFLSVSHKLLITLIYLAVIQAYLATWPAEDLPSIIRPPLVAAFITLFLFLPAIIINPGGIYNNLLVVIKVFISLEMVGIFNHTTQWNHITGALRRLHIPGVFIFIFDITLKYIVLLGGLIEEVLTSLSLRAVGKNNKKYQSIGGVLGVTFVRGSKMSQEMYEAMRCRGFTDDYKGL